MDDVHPIDFPLTVLHGWNSAVLNERARSWMTRHEPGARLTPVAGLTGCKTSARYTVIDLASPSTPAERSAAMAYVREVGKLQHATLKYHMFLVYDMHLVNSRCFQNLGFSRVLGTTSRMDSLSASIHSSAVFVRIRCPMQVPAQMASMAQAAVAGQCVVAARKFSHEALKTCLEPNVAFLALVEAAGSIGHGTTAKLASKPASSKPTSKPASSKPTSKPASSRPASKPTSKPTSKAVGLKKPAAKRLAKGEMTPAKAARRLEKCGPLKGGIDAYYYTDRCTLKKKLDTLMGRNRRAASFVSKAAQEMPTLKKVVEDTVVSEEAMSVALLDPIAVEKLVAYMTLWDKMEAAPEPEERLEAALADVAASFPNVAKEPDAFKKLAARGAYNSFEAAVENVKNFKGRPTQRKGAKRAAA